MDVVTKRDTPD